LFLFFVSNYITAPPQPRPLPHKKKEVIFGNTFYSVPIDGAVALAFKYTPPPPLKSLTAERGKFDSAPPSPASRADDSLALSYSTHSTFPMQTWQRPAAHLKRYARHLLLPPPPPHLPESRRPALPHRRLVRKRPHPPPPSSPPLHFRAPQAGGRLLRIADSCRFLSMAR